MKNPIDTLYDTFFTLDAKETNSVKDENELKRKFKDLTKLFSALGEPRQLRLLDLDNSNSKISRIDKLLSVLFHFLNHYIEEKNWPSIQDLIKLLDTKSSTQLTDKTLIKFHLAWVIYLEKAWLIFFKEKITSNSKDILQAKLEESLWENYVRYCSQLIWLIETIENEFSKKQEFVLIETSLNGQFNLETSYKRALENKERLKAFLCGDKTEDGILNTGFYGIKASHFKHAFVINDTVINERASCPKVPSAISSAHQIISNNNNLELANKQEINFDNNNQADKASLGFTKVPLVNAKNTNSAFAENPSSMFRKFYDKIELMNFARALLIFKIPQQLERIKGDYERQLSETTQNSLVSRERFSARLQMENALFRVKNILDHLNKRKCNYFVKLFYQGIKPYLEWYASLSRQILSFLSNQHVNIQVSEIKKPAKDAFLYTMIRFKLLVHMLAKHEQVELAEFLIESLPNKLDQGLSEEESKKYVYPLEEFNTFGIFIIPDSEPPKEETYLELSEDKFLNLAIKQTCFKDYQNELAKQMRAVTKHEDVFKTLENYTENIKKLIKNIADTCKNILCLDSVTTKTINEIISKPEDPNNIQNEILNVALSLPDASPCPFEIFGTGSIARGDLNYHSDLDIGILIHDVKFQKDPFFEVFYCFFETYISLIGQLNGGFSLDPGDKKFMFGDFPLLLNSPKNLVAELNPLHANFEVAYSAHRAQPLYQSEILNPSLFETMEELIKMNFEYDQKKDNTVSWDIPKTVFDSKVMNVPNFQKISGHYFLEHKHLHDQESGYSKSKIANRLKANFIGLLNFWLFNKAAQRGLHEKSPNNIALKFINEKNIDSNQYQAIWELLAQCHQIRFYMHKFANYQHDDFEIWSLSTDNNNNNQENASIAKVKTIALFKPSLYIQAEQKIQAYLDKQFKLLVKEQLYDENLKTIKMKTIENLTLKEELEYYIKEGDHTEFKALIQELSDFAEYLPMQNLNNDAKKDKTNDNDKKLFEKFSHLKSLLQCFEPNEKTIGDAITKLTNNNNFQKLNLSKRYEQNKASFANTLMEIFKALFKWTNSGKQKSFLIKALESSKVSTSIIECLLALCRNKLERNQDPDFFKGKDKDEDIEPYTYNLLHAACIVENKLNRPLIIKPLLEWSGLDTREQDNYGQTIFHLAARYINHELLESIAEFFRSTANPFDIEEQLLLLDSNHRAPLHYAAIQTSQQSLYWLLHFKDSFVKALEINDKDENTPLLLAARYGTVESVQILLEQGANPNHQNTSKQSIFHLAAIGQKDVTLDVLLNLKTQNRFKISLDLKKPDGFGRNPLHYSLYFQKTPHSGCTKLLEKRQELLSQADVYHHLPLHYAILNGDIDSVKIQVNLLKQGNKETFQTIFCFIDTQKNNVLHLAAARIKPKEDKSEDKGSDVYFEIYNFLHEISQEKFTIHKKTIIFNLDDKRRDKPVDHKTPKQLLKCTPKELLQHNHPQGYIQIYGAHQSLFGKLFKNNRNADNNPDNNNNNNNNYEP